MSFLKVKKALWIQKLKEPLAWVDWDILSSLQAIFMKILAIKKVVGDKTTNELSFSLEF